MPLRIPNNYALKMCARPDAFLYSNDLYESCYMMVVFVFYSFWLLFSNFPFYFCFFPQH